MKTSKILLCLTRQPWMLLLLLAFGCDDNKSTPTDGLDGGNPADTNVSDTSPADTNPTDANPYDADQTTKDYTIGVFYYPWYGANEFHGGEYLRGELAPPQSPTLGEYDDSRPEVIAQHLAWSRQANINLWVASWWGPDSRTDITLRDVIMPHDDLPGIKIALFYETTGRIGSDDDIQNAYTDIIYAAEHYFGDPNYLRIDDRPVIAVYLTRLLYSEDRLAETVDTMRSAAAERGYDLYIIGDQVFGNPPSVDELPYSPFDMLDAVTNYDVYGSMGRPRFAGVEGVEQRHAGQMQWRELAHEQSCAFIPSVSAGYNDKGVRDGHPALSRRLHADAPQGSLFQATLMNALNLVDESTANMLLINSWNEWHEDTQIEPVGHGEATSEPAELTDGLTYYIYGELYLEILRSAIIGESLPLPE